MRENVHDAARRHGGLPGVLRTSEPRGVPPGYPVVAKNVPMMLERTDVTWAMCAQSREPHSCGVASLAVRPVVSSPGPVEVGELQR